MKILYYFLIWVFLISCQEEKKFPNFQAEAWRQDKLGCLGTRQMLAQDFDSIRRDLNGLSQNQLLDILGRPDFQVLYKRNQKFYIYYLEPGNQCQGKPESSQARTVAIRLSALEKVTEVTYQNGKP